MVKKIQKTILVLVTVLMFLLPVTFYSHAEEANEGINIVFVLDSSTSMKTSDPDNLRTEAVKMFVDMCSDKDSAEIVSFGKDASVLYPLTRISDSKDKLNIKNSLYSIALTDATDTGAGIKKAVDSIGAASGKKSLIILLSDGRNDPVRNINESKNDMDEAVSTAKSKGYAIYTIGLNSDGKLDISDLKNMSGKTGGKLFTPSSASELPEIFQNIFSEFLSLKNVLAGNVSCDGSYKSINVDVPNSNAEEADVIVTSKNNLDVKIYKSDGKELDKSSYIKTSSKKYTLVKIIKPKKESFKLSIKGEKGDTAKVNCILNYQLTIENEYSKISGIKKNDDIVVKSILKSNGNSIDDKEIYNEIQCILYCTNKTKGYTDKIAMKNNGNGFTADIKIKDDGEYEIKTAADGKGLHKESKVWNFTLQGAKFQKALKKQSINFKYILMIIMAAIGLTCIIFCIKFFKKTPKVKSKSIKKVINKITSCEVSIIVKNDVTSEEAEPIFKNLKNYNGSFSLSELMLNLPEFSEMKKIAIENRSNGIFFINNSRCNITKNNESQNGIVEIKINNNDIFSIKLVSKNKTINIKFFNIKEECMINKQNSELSC